jgi:hypothetical protein
MSDKKKDVKESKVMVRGRLSFPELIEGKVDASGKRKWGVTVVLDPEYDLMPLKRAALAVLTAKFGKEEAAKMVKSGKAKLIGGEKHLIRNDETSSFPEGQNLRVAARSTRKPQVVSIYPDQRNPKLPAIIPESEYAEKVYPGANALVSLSAFWYEHESGKGLTWSLGNIQILGGGDRFDSYVAAQDEFEVDESAAASLEDLENANANEDTGDDDDIGDLLK